MEHYLNEHQMKSIDTCSIQNTGIPSLVLMERAALAVAEEIMQDFSPADGQILSVCAMGNNGADGMAAARILALKGYSAAVLLVGNPQKATSEWQVQYQILKNLGISCTFLKECHKEELLEYIKNGETQTVVVIDALFGIGLTRAVTGFYGELIEAVNASGLPVVAVDIPSGLFAHGGQFAHGEQLAGEQPRGAVIRAWKTVTFGWKKIGQMVYPGAEYCGQLKAVEIGFAPEAFRKAGYEAFGYEKQDLPAMMKQRPANSHKGTFGRILIIAGNEEMAGAAAFSARAAYRMGCGLVKIHTAADNRTSLHQLVPEAVLSLYDPQNYSMERLKQECSWADVIVFGPGVGRKEHLDRILDWLLEQNTCPLVLDADGLRILAEHPDWYERLSTQVILTPHPGEMSALTGLRTAQIQENPMAIACDFAATHHCICLLKGARTIVAQPEGPYYINTSGCSAMATAGSGDVLTGIIAALLAEGHNTMTAATLGAYIHGLAGEQAAGIRGERAVMATDLAEALYNVINV